MEGANQRNAAIASFLKGIGNTGKQVASTTSSYVSSYTTNTFSPEGGSYILKVLFFIFLYLFIAFIILVVIHNTVYPIFRFKPGDKGFIAVPGTDKDSLYLTKQEVPPTVGYYPMNGDTFNTYSFLDTFTISVDVFVRKLPTTNAFTRLLLVKAPASNTPIPPPSPPEGTPMTNDFFLDHMSNYSSMIMYLTDTNDLSITLFSGPNGTPYSIPYIKNVPLYTPFRITVVVQKDMFIVYLNARQVFQRVIPGGIKQNFKVAGTIHKFYVGPDWSNLPTQSVFLHNLHIWNRPLLFQELVQATPALASEADFGMAKEISS